MTSQKIKNQDLQDFVSRSFSVTNIQFIKNCKSQSLSNRLVI
jgi:hypothetical protein